MHINIVDVDGDAIYDIVDGTGYQVEDKVKNQVWINIRSLVWNQACNFTYEVLKELK